MSTLNTRRRVLELGGSALAGVAIAACGGGNAADAPSKPAFVLVHGAWHGAWTYAKVIPELSALGYTAVAVDLPGHGLDAQFPVSYLQRPLDAAFATEVSPVAGVSVDQCADLVVQVIDQMLAAGFPGVVLVGHSMGGVTITRVAERTPRKVLSLVYLNAFMISNGQTVLDAAGLPENSTGEVLPLLLADPAAIGALRIDPNSGDTTYRAKCKSAFYGDLTPAQFQAAANLLTPDEPALLFTTPTARTVAGWGSVRRHYIKSLQDHAVPTALQQRFIDEADSFTPSNRTVVHTLDSSHSPFISMPKLLAQELAKAAG